jgi:hypothetical protein
MESVQLAQDQDPVVDWIKEHETDGSEIDAPPYSPFTEDEEDNEEGYCSFDWCQIPQCGTRICKKCGLRIGECESGYEAAMDAPDEHIDCIDARMWLQNSLPEAKHDRDNTEDKDDNNGDVIVKKQRTE